MISPSRVLAITLRQGYLIRGSFSRVLPLFLWVAIDMVLWGFISKYLSSITSAGLNFIPTLLGGILLWDFFIRVMQGVTTAFLEDVWSRNFLNIFATPMSTSEYLGGLILTSICTSLVGLVAMVILASLAFGLSFFSYGMLLVPFLLSLFLMGIAMGILACAMVLRLGPSAEWFVWPIPTVLAPFAGVFYPVSTLPGWMQIISRGIPASYVFEGVRDIVAGGQASPLLAAGALSLGGLYIVGAAWVFRRVYKHALKTGLIARYSAESVT
jgi:ABC-2 type transport system permease protein